MTSKIDRESRGKRYPYRASLFFITISCIALGLLIMLPAHKRKENDKLYVVCTTGIIADLVHQIGGDLVVVDALMGVGVDPHMYRARESDMHKIAQADIILYHGLHLEGKMATMFSRMNSDACTRNGVKGGVVSDINMDSVGVAVLPVLESAQSDLAQISVAGATQSVLDGSERAESQIAVVSVSDSIPKHKLKTSECADIYDPHIWHDVSLWRYAALQVGAVLQQQDSKNKKAYEKKLANYLATLDALDTYIHARMATIAPEKRILITAHDAFGYFGKAYGCEVVGLQGISTDSEISTGDIARIVAIICAYQVPVIFVESLIPERTIQAVRQAVLARGKQVTIGKELFSDALGDKESGAYTYVDMIKHNVEVIVEALGE